MLYFLCTFSMHPVCEKRYINTFYLLTYLRGTPLYLCVPLSALEVGRPL